VVAMGTVEASREQAGWLVLAKQDRAGLSPNKGWEAVEFGALWRSSL
jgi:hypothetical protein